MLSIIWGHLINTFRISITFVCSTNSSVSQIPRYLAASGSQRPNPEHAFHRGPTCDTGTLGLVWLTACQAQRAPTLIGQRWSTISASIGYPRLNPLWLVTHCTLSHAHHSFQSHMYHLACMEMANFLCAIFNWLKLQRSHQFKTIIIE